MTAAQGAAAELDTPRPVEGVADEQSRVVLTAHPLQRVGAYALTLLGNAVRPESLTVDGFRRAMETIVTDSVNAALVRDTKSERGFWLKCSHPFFPNSKMNHPGNYKKDDAAIRNGVVEWLSTPETPYGPAWHACCAAGRPSGSSEKWTPRSRKATSIATPRRAATRGWRYVGRAVLIAPMRGRNRPVHRFDPLHIGSSSPL